VNDNESCASWSADFTGIAVAESRRGHMLVASYKCGTAPSDCLRHLPGADIRAIHSITAKKTRCSIRYSTPLAFSQGCEQMTVENRRAECELFTNARRSPHLSVFHPDRSGVPKVISRSGKAGGSVQVPTEKWDVALERRSRD